MQPNKNITYIDSNIEKWHQEFKQYLTQNIKEYLTLELIKNSEGVFWALPSLYPEDKNPNVVWIIEVRLSNWKILNGLKDIETNKLYFSKEDMDLIFQNLWLQ